MLVGDPLLLHEDIFMSSIGRSGFSHWVKWGWRVFTNLSAVAVILGSFIAAWIVSPKSRLIEVNVRFDPQGLSPAIIWDDRTTSAPIPAAWLEPHHFDKPPAER